MSSHNLDDVADIATDVGIIHEGKMLFSEGMDQIRDGFGLVEIVDGELEMPEYLKEHVIKTGSAGQVSQWLVRDRSSEGIERFLAGPFGKNASVRDLSLRELFVYLTTEELIC
jgi:ABC-type multidrug transport system ATPase subunit